VQLIWQWYVCWWHRRSNCSYNGQWVNLSHIMSSGTISSCRLAVAAGGHRLWMLRYIKCILELPLPAFTYVLLTVFRVGVGNMDSDDTATFLQISHRNHVRSVADFGWRVEFPTFDCHKTTADTATNGHRDDHTQSLNPLLHRYMLFIFVGSVHWQICPFRAVFWQPR